jgi:hypothetical protein
VGANVYTAHAALTIIIGGVEYTIETDGKGENTGDAIKTYVDASIALTPQTGTNEIDDEHEITATVTKDDGTGPVPAEGETVTFAMTSGTAEFVGGVNTCVTDALGQCSVSIIDDTAGLNSVDASVTVSVGILELERATNGDTGPDGSDDADKTYVDARIAIDPLTATNNINDPHTFTVHVEENAGSGWVDAAGETVDFSLIDNTAGAVFVGDVDSCTTDSDGECTVTINSATPGTVAVHAASDVSVGGLTLPRETNGTDGNSADGVKTYVAGKIIVEKVTVGGDGEFEFNPSWSNTNFFLSHGESENSGWIATGTYSVAESVPTGWDLTSAICSDGSLVTAISLQADETVTCIFTNTKRAKLTIVKDAEPNDAQNFVFSGTGGIGAFTLDDDAGVVDPADPLGQYQNATAPYSLVQGSYTVTETQPNQYWKLKSATCVVTGTTNAYSASLVGSALTVALTPGADVTCTFVNEKISPTRTQGFWQTHTTFTNSVFASKFPTGMQIGVGIVHKGVITNLIGNATSHLYGAWYSSIPKLTTGAQRTALDKARMQLLQQLVTAKLNCAQFGCSTSVQTMISSADAAYAGSSASAIITAAGKLDAYNNSGDSIIVGNTGKATPKTSQGYANKVFWNAP